MLTISHHFFILQKSQGGHREREHCQNPTNLKFSQTEIKLKISHHLQVNTPHSVMTSKDLMTKFNITIYVLTQSGGPAVRECTTIDTSLHVSLSYDGHVIPLPEWFRHGQNCTVTRFSMLENFASHIKQKGDECSVILKELNNIQYYKPQG